MIIKPYISLCAAFFTCLAVTAEGAEPSQKVYTLQDAYQAALSTNEGVKIAEENVYQSESRIDQAWTYLYPNISSESAVTRYNKAIPPSGDFIFQPLNSIQTALVLKQPLYTGGRTLAALRTAKTLRDVSVNTLSSTRQDTMLEAALRYYGVIKAEKMIDVNRRSLERMERHKKVTEREAATRKTKANVSSLLRANTLVNQARINLVRAEDGLTVARSQLSLVTNLPSPAVIAEPEMLEPDTSSLEQLKEKALVARPDYAASLRNIEVAKENVTIVRGAHYPQVYAQGAMQYQHSSPETLQEGWISYGALQLEIPIFEGGLMKAETSEARSKIRQSELSANLLKRSIENEVYEAYINLRTISSVLNTAKLQLRYAKENFDAVEGLYREGLASSLSMIDAEQALSQAEQEVVNSTYDQQLGILRLKRSIGTLATES
jgi:outer membrane protein